MENHLLLVEGDSSRSFPELPMSQAEKWHMAQDLPRRRLKIVPVVYALSTLHQNLEFSTTLRSQFGN